MSKQDKALESAQRAGELAAALRENEYVQRLIEDEELRDTLRESFDAARSAYDRANRGKGPTARKVVKDKKLQEDLRKAADSLREAKETLEKPPPSERSSNAGRLLLIAFAGAILAVAVSEDLRRALLDKLFGAEEEFEYTSTTSPQT